MLQACRLTKRYGGLLALDRVSFSVNRGEIVGYLGPNGCDKSTTVNLVVGLLQPSSGSIRLDGRRLSDDPAWYKQRVGYVPEEPYLYTHLTAAEYLMLVGRLRRMPQSSLDGKVDTLLRLFLLHESRYSAIASFSKGMRQRVLLAAALLHNPDLLSGRRSCYRAVRSGPAACGDLPIPVARARPEDPDRPANRVALLHVARADPVCRLEAPAVYVLISTGKA